MRDETLTSRRIGGSEISALFGVNDYLDEFGLWARKKGGIPPEEPNDRMRLGKHLERGIAEYFAELEGVEIEWDDQTHCHPDYPFMVYTPDASVVGQDRGIDCKLVGWDQAHSWGRDSDHIPDHAVMQAWWYMAAKDYLRWDVVALVMGEDRPRIYPVHRDADAERVMLRKAEEWWRRYLLGDERPPITASDHSSAWLRRAFPRHRRNSLQEATPEESRLLDEYAYTRRRFKLWERKRLDLEARIKEAIADREGLKWPGGKFTWKLTRDSERVEWEQLAEALLARHPAREELIGEFTTTRPGIRRIYFKTAAGEEEEL